MINNVKKITEKGTDTIEYRYRIQPPQTEMMPKKPQKAITDPPYFIRSE